MSRTLKLDQGVILEDSIAKLAKAASIPYACALTNRLYRALYPKPAEIAVGKTLDGRVWTMLAMFQASSRITRVKPQGKQDEDLLHFEMPIEGIHKTKYIIVRAVSGPDDHGGIAITFDLPDESAP